MQFITNPIYVLAILCLNIVISEWLSKKKFFKHLGTSLLVIILTAVLANIGMIPTASDNSPVYEGIFIYVAPIAIFFLLLGVHIKQLKAAGLPMMLMFLIGSGATAIGAIISIYLISGEAVFGSIFHAIAGMMTGTYTGGSINFNTIALHYNVMREGNLFAGIVAADSFLTTIWMIATIAIPKYFQKRFPRKSLSGQKNHISQELTDANEGREKVEPNDVALLLAIALFSLWISNTIATWFQNLGVNIPAILIVTTLALIIAQLPIIQKIKGARLLGIYSVYLFLATIGAYCELIAFPKLGDLAITILIFTTIIVVVHGLIIYGIGALLKQDWDLISVASQANIGGAGTALALAKSLNRNDLLLPGILVSALGNGIGTYLGFLVAYYFN
ncbi:DUF819 family protein [Fulvivirgaceae bacterium BMA10]|uniref:DUF819 family protein n=1 Tax=Splendidivirga corallicola TaxID=3051826 RepID=A0ABT8KTQ8_9BACT|nr:DUF819 family protein [Fulvivirgaceae bacterium BMA10]